MFLYGIMFHLCTFTVGDLFQEAEYIKTMVINEPTDCRFHYDLLNVKKVLSIAICGMLCSNTDHCRRIMFDKQTQICKLYESGENCLTNGNPDDQVCYRQKSVCSRFTCKRCPIGYYGNTCHNIIQDCSDGAVRMVARRKPLISYIQPSVLGPILEVQCNFNNNITLIHHRDKSCKEVDFNRTWEEYRYGFGYAHSEYWLGLEHINNTLRNHPNFELIVKLVVSDLTPHASWSNFKLLDNDFKFSAAMFREITSPKVLGDALTNGSYSIVGRPFSTFDRDYSNHSCPDRFKGGWWYLDDIACSRTNPNGRRNFDKNVESTIFWQDNIVNRSDLNEILFYIKRI